TLDCADSGGLYATPRPLDIYVTDDEVTMADFSGMTISQAVEAAQTMRPWLTQDPGLSVTFACNDAELGDVFDQDPAASSTIDATETVSVSVSLGGQCLLRRRR